MKDHPILALGALLLGLTLFAGACSEPECPDGFFKVGKICRRVDAGTELDDAAVLAGDGGTDAEPNPQRDSGDEPKPDAASTGSDAGQSSGQTQSDAGATTSSSADAATGTDAGLDATMAMQDAGSAEASVAQDSGPTSCAAGYVLRGSACQDLDECFEGTQQCHPTATCRNTAGSYDCTCPQGYSGGTAAGFACAPRIAVGTEHACVLMADATVQCWGKNANGQVGDGTRTERLTPTSVLGLRDVVAINAGLTATCALVGDGGLRCWGANGGALGSGSASDQVVPAFVQQLNTVVAFDIYEGHGCAVLRDGTVKCWGANSDGQLGSGVASAEPLSPVGVIGVRDATQVFVGSRQTCVILRNGAARCWGIVQATQTSSLTPVELPVPSTVKSISFGAFHGCSVHMGGATYCWGPPALGGNGTTQGDYSPRPVQGLTATSIVLGVYSSVALRPDATVVWWDASRTPAVLADVTSVVAVASAGTQVCHLLRDGIAACWTLANAVLTQPVSLGGLDLW